MTAVSSVDAVDPTPIVDVPVAVAATPCGTDGAVVSGVMVVAETAPDAADSLPAAS